ncbi:MAG: BglII/BstYI family type II restriction endonuclease [Amaricoccus sp.]|uniref:BglII/BstYI family type II restriction endonuclease n=1 Tax=Amaricoccus sp. TaxID=1872485 RepID=UPI0039E2F37C
MLDELRAAGFDVLTRNHAEAILAVDFPDETAELVRALEGFRIPADEIVGSGGGEARSTQRLRRGLAEVGWRKHRFEMALTIDGRVKEAQTHEIDHVRWGRRGTLALEIEWNNKDPFFDRDLENFQRLHAQSVISLGIIVTRGAALNAGMAGLVAAFLRARGVDDAEALMQFGMKRRTDRQVQAVERLVAGGAEFAEAFARTFIADKFGQATTHWKKLEDRVRRGVGNPCPLLLLGLPASVVGEMPAAAAEPDLLAPAAPAG